MYSSNNSSVIFFLHLIISLCTFASCSSDDQGGGDTPSATIKLTGDDLSILEPLRNQSVFANIRLSEPSAEDIHINWRTKDGTAHAGLDYEMVPLTSVTIEAGAQSYDLQITVLADDLAEDHEYFFVELSTPDNIDIVHSEIKITIEDDDVDTDIVIPSSGYSTPLDYDNMTKIWADEFDGSDINKNNWTFEMGNGQSGWGNNELQYYREQNAFIKDGFLVIEARREQFGGFDYTSTRMITRQKVDFTYGRVDIRAALPYGQGIWPALWMLGSNISFTNWPDCGEIDIMEMIGGGPGRDDTVHGTAHWGNNGHTYLGGSKKLTEGSFQNEFHVFSVRWDEQLIRWYVDDQLYYSLDITSDDKAEFHNPFFFIFNIAVGGNWPGSPDATTRFPQRMIVDYIRVFQPN